VSLNVIKPSSFPVVASHTPICIPSAGAASLRPSAEYVIPTVPARGKRNGGQSLLVTAGGGSNRRISLPVLTSYRPTVGVFIPCTARLELSGAKQTAE